MKTILSAILWLALAVSAFAGVNLKLAWDPKPAGDTRTSTRIYEKVGTTYTQVAEVQEPATTVTLTNVAIGTHTYVARAWNGQQESVDSNSVQSVILQAPQAPTTVTITVIIQ